METMERMFVMLCCAAAFLLSAVIPVQGSKVLDSLNCFNNYFSLVNCTWTADRPYAHLFNVTLYSSIAEYKPSTPCQSPTQTNLTWTCYFSRSYFYYLLCEEYALLPDRSLEIQLNLTDKDTGLLEHPAPIIYSSEDRYFLLWSEANSALENQTQNISQCESRHKKISEAWEKSSVGECIDSWGVFKPEPGVLHVAKMRVKYINDHWSNWSSEVVLEPKQAEDEAKPQNLRCMHLVGQVLCVWELRVEVADLVAFKLFYKQLNKSDEEECQPTCQAEVPNVPYISCRCSFKMGNLNATSWQISVKPGEEKKPILARDNVLYGPPININVQEKDQGQLYQVRWSTETIEHTLKSHFQICYWREGQHPKNVTFPDCQYELQNKSNNEDRVLGLRLGKELKPLSTYNIKVRMIIKESEKDCPCGPWSEWSKSQTWKTKAVPNHMLLYVMIPICIIILIVCSLCGYKYMRRYKKKWEEMLPDPSKSNLILQFQQKSKKSQSYLNCTEYHAYEELADSCRINDPNTIDMIPKEEKRLSTSSEQSHHNLIYWTPPEVPDEDEAYDVNETTLIIESGYQPFEELVCESQSEAYSKEDFAPSEAYSEEDFAPSECNDTSQQSQFAPIAFDGPYLFCS